MIVTLGNLQDVLSDIASSDSLAIDTETTGLYPYKDDKLLSVIVATDKESYYFNFHSYPKELQGVDYSCLDLAVLFRLKEAISKSPKIIFGQNIKFDLKFLFVNGCVLRNCKIYDLMFLDRIHYNCHKSYSLKEISSRWGSSKLDIVWNYIESNKLFCEWKDPVTGRIEKKPLFDRVPFDLISRYGEQDGRTTYDVGRKILLEIEERDRFNKAFVNQMNVVEIESKLVDVLFRMENIGICVDLDYCQNAYNYYREQCENAKIEFKKQTGLEFVKGTLVFEKVFANEKEKWVKTEKGNWKWDSNVLEKFSNPAAKVVLDYSESKKQLDYFENILFFSSHGIIHPDFRQAGTVTGRMSCVDPNLQNLTSPDKYENNKVSAKFPVRRGFIPRDGCFFAMLDYDQMEFRLMLDMAWERGLIYRVLSGEDVHEATAKIAGCSRKEAKMVNFLTLYGGGVVALVMNLFGDKVAGSASVVDVVYSSMKDSKVHDKNLCSKKEFEVNSALIKEAIRIRSSILNSMPNVCRFVDDVKETALKRGFIFNRYGRRYYFNKTNYYAAPNHLIQGTCADIMKIAMNRIDDYLMNKKSRLALSIHDELILEVAYGEEEVVYECKRIMENVYEYNNLPLTVSVDYSKYNLCDKIEFNEEARDSLKGKDNFLPTGNT